MMSRLAYATSPSDTLARRCAGKRHDGRIFGAMAVMAALMDAKKPAKGQYVQSGLFETASWLVIHAHHAIRSYKENL